MPAHVDPNRIEVIDDELAEVLWQKTAAERVEMVSAANPLPGFSLQRVYVICIPIGGIRKSRRRS